MSDSVQKQLADLQKQINVLEKRLAQYEKGGAVKEKVKRAPSKYNQFMSTENGKNRKENPDWDQSMVMKEVAKRWNAQKNE